MQLDLKPIRQPETPFDQTYAAESFPPESDYRVIAPVHLVMTIHKDEDKFRLVGTRDHPLELHVQPLPRAVHGAGAMPPFDLRYLPQALAGRPRGRSRRRRPRPTFYDDDQIDLGQMVREQFTWRCR